MSSRPSQTTTLAEYLGSASSLFFVVATLLITVGGAALFALVQIAMGTGKWAMFGVFVVTVPIGFSVLFLFVHFRPLFFNSMGPEISTESEVDPSPYLITFVSKPPGNAHEASVEFHLDDVQNPVLKKCWLVHTGESGEEAGTYAKTIKQQTNGKVTLYSDERWQLDNFNDPFPAYTLYCAAIRDAKKTAKDKQQISAEQIIVDVTGGTKMVTVGAVFACLKEGATPFYLKQGVEEGKREFAKIDIEWTRNLEAEEIAESSRPTSESD